MTNSGTVDGKNQQELKLAKRKTFSVLPVEAFKEVLEVLELGCDKYDGKGYLSPDYQLTSMDLLDAIGRHLLKYVSGIDRDDESGVSHLAHVAAGAMVLLDGLKHNTIEDNRQ